MIGMRGWAVLVGALAVAAPSGAARGQGNIVLPRAGQVGLSGQGGFGTLLEGGLLGDEFGGGGAFGVRLRYRMRYERAIALSFESQRLEARDPGRADGAFLPILDDTTLTRQRAVLTLAGVELFQMFGTRTRNPRMLGIGAGLAQLSARLSNGETQYPKAGDGVYLSAIAGTEYFFWRSLAWDLGVRYFAVFHDGKANHDVQGSAGIIFYAGY